MSKFRVKLNQGPRQNNFDTTANFTGVSAQRTVHLTSPSGKGMVLKDGETFDGSNYWKQYCQPACSVQDAILELVYDDGIEYNSQNKYPVILKRVVQAHTDCDLKVTVDAKKDCGGKIVSAQITNRSQENEILIKFNKSEKAKLELMANETQSFNEADFPISTIDFINNSAENIKVQILMSVVADSKFLG